MLDKFISHVCKIYISVNNGLLLEAFQQFAPSYEQSKQEQTAKKEQKEICQVSTNLHDCKETVNSETIESNMHFFQSEQFVYATIGLINLLSL